MTYGVITLWPLFAGLIAAAPVWVLIVFLCYVAGRGRQVSIAELLAIITLEAIALAIAAPSFIMAR